MKHAHFSLRVDVAEVVATGGRGSAEAELSTSLQVVLGM